MKTAEMTDDIREVVERLDAIGTGRSRDDVPFARSYWVVPGRLLAGFFPGSPEHQLTAVQCGALVDRGIRHCVSLMEEHEVNRQGERFVDYAPALVSDGERARFSRFPIRDLGVPSVEEMRRTLDAIDASLDAGEGVYVHCWGGKGRTGTAVGCWMLRHGLATPETVLDTIAWLRRNVTDAHLSSPETHEQRRFVLEWRG